MSKDSAFETKHCKVLANQLKLMRAITAPIRAQVITNKKTMEALNEAAQSTSGTSIQVLKRPSFLARGQVLGVSNMKPVKGLEQRRREYEEARLRILGAARNPEDDDDKNYKKNKRNKDKTDKTP